MSFSNLNHYGRWLRLNGLWFLILLFAFFVPLSQYISMRILGVVFLLSLPRASLSHILDRAWDIGLYVVVLIVGIAYSDDVSFGVSTLETSLSLVVLPIVLSGVASLNRRRLSSVLLTFIFGMFLGSCICMTHALIRYMNLGSPAVFLYYELTSALDLQPTYFAYFLVFSITCVIYLISFQKLQVGSVVLSLVGLMFFIVLLLTGGRTSFIGMLLVCAFFVLKFLLDPESRNQRITIGVVLVIIVGLLWTAYWVGDSTIFTDSWERYDLWESAIRANPDLVWGVGTGDYKMVLNDYFAKHGMIEFASESLNAHNQFIQTYLSNGIIGLIALLIMIVRPLYLAFRQDNALPILVIFPFLIYAMTEVFLGRYQGVVFFAFVHQIFVSHLLTVDKHVLISKST